MKNMDGKLTVHDHVMIKNDICENRFFFFFWYSGNIRKKYVSGDSQKGKCL